MRLHRKSVALALVAAATAPVAVVSGPAQADPGASTSSGNTHAVPAVSGGEPGDLLMGGVITDGSTPSSQSFTSPDGWSERHDPRSDREGVTATVADTPLRDPGTAPGVFRSSSADDSLRFAVLLEGAADSAVQDPDRSGSTPPEDVNEAPMADAGSEIQTADGTVESVSANAPSGPAGSWTLEFADGFNGTSLNTSRWASSWVNGGPKNNVSTSASNVSVANGKARLQLSSASTGALIHTEGGRVNGRYAMEVGDVVEARVWFPGNGTDLFNWPAWWVNDTYDGVSGMPMGGEHDIAEVLSSHRLTVNYHSPSGAHNQGAVDGYWGDGWHVYTLHRRPSSADVYYDGQLVRSYPTDDNGTPLDLIFNVGTSNDAQSGVSPATGPAGAMRIDWVRAYERR